jgi:peptide methionine sulfoxide reductase MsrA
MITAKQLPFCIRLLWCTEHVFEAVIGAVSGYSGGDVKNYELVGSNRTGHAEGMVFYDPKVVSLKNC